MNDINIRLSIMCFTCVVSALARSAYQFVVNVSSLSSPCDPMVPLRQQFLKFPDVIGDSGFHGGRDA